MLRTVAGVVLGYLAMAILVFVIFTLAYLAMGAERAFQPESFEVSSLWASMAVVVNVLAAIAGGFVAATVGKGATAPRILAAIVFILGLLLAVAQLASPTTEGAAAERSSELSNIEAMSQAKQPTWFAFTTPFVGAIGVLIGAGLRPRKAA